MNYKHRTNTDYCKGEKNPAAKLKDADVILIRQLIAERRELETKVKAINNKSLAEKFGVSIDTIQRVDKLYGVYSNEIR